MLKLSRVTMLVERAILSRAQPNHIRRLTRRSLDSSALSQRSSDSQTTGFNPISTLDPAGLKPSDHIDISSLTRYALRIHSSRHRKGIPVLPFFTYYKHEGVASTFPPRTTGYFYFYRPENRPSTAAGIRFRIASVNPAKFSNGRDLLRPDGLPWEIPLPRVQSRAALRKLLLQDGLVTQTELKECETLTPLGRPRNILYRFDQPFSLSFGGAQHIQIAVGTQKLPHRLLVVHEQRRRGWVHPYSGRALVRFELSSLPEHAKAPIILRVVKMITPPTLQIPDYDGHMPRPVEGELIYRAMGTTAVLKPWGKSLSCQLGKALRLLLEAQPPAETR
ncbi:hypothetical protein B0H14DRAFT_1636240 [Mycena olivaceomarginata]|nr:hypothetical protein B0H14DRAFT_1636240 [Mycena olivaceomarginata]